MSSGLSNLGIALTVVFIVSLFSLLAQLFFVLRRRRAFLLRIPTPTTTTTNDSFSSPSKEQLLYFFCLRTSHLSRIEPSNLSAGSPISNGSGPEREVEVIDILKLQSMYEPSRFLCPIKEGDREGVESADERSAEKEKKNHDTEIGGEPPLEAVLVKEDVQNTTPFSTPCASPLFLTPLGSLTEEDLKSLPL